MITSLVTSSLDTTTFSLVAGTLLGVVLLLAACRTSEPEATGGNDDVLISYAYGGGMDMYQDGDRYGHRIVLYFDGTYTLYERTYREAEDERRSIDEKAIGQGTLDAETVDLLRQKAPAAHEWPERMPDVDPRRVPVREPAETVTLDVRTEPGESAASVQANMGADAEHYPDRFWSFHREMRELLEEKREALSE